MGIGDERQAEAAKRPSGASKKAVFIVAAAPISLILLWILMAWLLPLFLK